MENWYKFLKIKNFSDIKEVKQAYRNLSRKYHPDNFIDSSEDEKKKSEKIQKKLNEIWQTLSDEKKKQSYDEKLKYELDHQKYSNYFKKSNQRPKCNSTSQYNDNKSFSSQDSQKKSFSSQGRRKGFFSSEDYQKGFFSSEDYQKGFFSSPYSNNGSFTSPYSNNGSFTSPYNNNKSFSSQDSQKNFSHSDEPTQESDKHLLLLELSTKQHILRCDYMFKKTEIMEKIKNSEEYRNLYIKCNQLDRDICLLQNKRDSFKYQIDVLMYQEAVNKESLFSKLFKRNRQLNQSTAIEKELQQKLNDLLDEITCKKKEKQEIEEKMKLMSEEALNQNAELNNMIAKIDEIDVQIETIKSEIYKESNFDTMGKKNGRNKK